MSGVAIAFAIWGSLTGTVGIVMALARTSPDDARSNLSKWAEWAGIHRIPEWLRSRSVDEIVFQGASRVFAMLLLFGAVGGGYMLWPSAHVVMPAPSMAPPPAAQNPQNDISRLLGELPELYDIINVAKNSLLPQIQMLVNNSVLANGGSIQTEIENANAIANDITEYEKNVDRITKDKYDSNILIGLIDGKDILHILEFHLLEYSRIMMPLFPHQPDNFDQYKWLLGNPQYLHERDLLNAQSEIFKKWIDDSSDRIQQKRKQLNTAIENAQ